MTQKHGHYYKDITNLQKLDIYRIIDLYDVRDGAIQHAIKKLLLAGGRGVKDMRTDIQEAIDSLNRKLEMLNEDDEVLEEDVMINLEDIKYPLPATSLNARCYVAKVDCDSNFHQETVSCDTQSLDPKYNDVNHIKTVKKDESNFEAYLPSKFEIEEFLKKYPTESYDSAFRKIAISNFQNMKYKLK